MDEYPRMLYRPGRGPSEVWGEFVDTLTVNSPLDEEQALKCGWMYDPQRAVAHARRKRQVRDILRRIFKDWHQKPLGLIFIGVIVAYIVHLFT